MIIARQRAICGRSNIVRLLNYLVITYIGYLFAMTILVIGILQFPQLGGSFIWEFVDALLPVQLMVIGGFAAIIALHWYYWPVVGEPNQWQRPQLPKKIREWLTENNQLVTFDDWQDLYWESGKRNFFRLEILYLVLWKDRTNQWPAQRKKLARSHQSG